MTRIDRVVVAIPARDEEQRLPAALAAVRAAVGRCAVPVVVVVAADACTDRTAELAAGEGALVVRSSAGRVGGARAAAVRAALTTDGPAAARTWIASTDADSVVPADWLAVHLEHAERGTDLLRGAVRPDPAGLTPAQLRRWLALHPPTERHAHVHGANLGVTAEAYLAAGGFPDVAVQEDVLLVRAVLARGGRVDSTASAPVVTSARPRSRTEGGFATYLRTRVLPAPAAT
ncbi:glycosyltransferase family 2 protein [Amnibacterium soli]|uniref:4,4'-diaponeurosporenoate glycosyltransferase n=1 Tax=Amnibacterium soli TaxID=1282736 RepID=A0ABP8YS58_9MICO